MPWTEGFEHLIRTTLIAHSVWAGPLAFGLAFGESLAFISLLLPATAALAIVGVLVGQGLLDFWWVILWAIPGAAIGDWISYSIGRRFKSSITNRWPFKTRPELLVRGHSFFAKFGSHSVFLGRFFGPVRAVIPLVAGMMQMPIRRFQIANWLSALVWAPYWILVGVLGERFFQFLKRSALLPFVPVGLVIAALLYWFWKRYRYSQHRCRSSQVEITKL